MVVISLFELNFEALYLIRPQLVVMHSMIHHEMYLVTTNQNRRPRHVMRSLFWLVVTRCISWWITECITTSWGLRDIVTHFSVFISQNIQVFSSKYAWLSIKTRFFNGYITLHCIICTLMPLLRVQTCAKF